ncbi:MAG: hypothetical protein ABJA02_11320 [Acidobacteriota bacterium]
MNYYNYFTEIEDTFIRRRGKSLFLSPLDWALIETWQDRGIPLHIVIRSIESVFDVFNMQPVGTRTIKSLFYCREEIEIQHGEWIRSQAGASSGDAAGEVAAFSIESVREHIGRAVTQLEAINSEAMLEDIGRAVERLNEFNVDPGDDFEQIDGTLSDIEKMLDRSVRSNWEKEHLKVLEKEIADQLKGYKASMEPEAYKQTFDLMLLKRLREEAGIPRLGLFYL